MKPITFFAFIAFVLAIPPLTDKLVEYQFQTSLEDSESNGSDHGYTQEETAAHTALVLKSLAEAEEHHARLERPAREVKLYRPATEKEAAEVFATIFEE